jgi:two-component system OmpR family sensor kinase
MTLRTKVQLAVSLAVIVSLTLLGTFALSTYRTLAIDNLSSQLADTVREIESTDDSPLQSAFYLSTVSNFPLLVGIADTKGKVTSLSEEVLPVKRIALTDLKASTSKTVELETDVLLIRSVALESSGYVVLASSLAAINQTLVELQRNIIIAALLLIVSNALLLHLLTRGDFARIRRLVEESNAIAAGNYKSEVTSVAGTNEVAQLSQSIAAMTSTLQENAENLQTLFGSISHELKTPLTAIRGYVELMESTDNITEEQLKSLDIIASEVERMTALINDLLLLSKLGTLTYELTDTFDIERVIERRVQVIRDLQPERNIEIIGSSHIVTASQGLIERLIDNLVANLINHTSNTTNATFMVSSTPTSWTLEYNDNGPGLPSAYTQSGEITILKFDPRKSSGSSTGLGLFIIQSIVLQHHGTIEMSSGPGLRMVFTFPL